MGPCPPFGLLTLTFALHVLLGQMYCDLLTLKGQHSLLLHTKVGCNWKTHLFVTALHLTHFLVQVIREGLLCDIQHVAAITPCRSLTNTSSLLHIPFVHILTRPAKWRVGSTLCCNYNSTIQYNISGGKGREGGS